MRSRISELLLVLTATAALGCTSAAPPPVVEAVPATAPEMSPVSPPVVEPEPAPVQPDLATPAFTTVTFERTPCEGSCAVYRVTVSAQGEVTFEGIRNVDSAGVRTAMLAPGQVIALRVAFDEAQFFSLDERYGYGEHSCRDHEPGASRIITSYTFPGETRKVDHDLGCVTVPASLAALYARFDEIVGFSRWVRGSGAHSGVIFSTTPVAAFQPRLRQ